MSFNYTELLQLANVLVGKKFRWQLSFCYIKSLQLANVSVGKYLWWQLSSDYIKSLQVANVSKSGQMSQVANKNWQVGQLAFGLGGKRLLAFFRWQIF